MKTDALQLFRSRGEDFKQQNSRGVSGIIIKLVVRSAPYLIISQYLRHGYDRLGMSFEEATLLKLKNYKSFGKQFKGLKSCLYKHHHML